MPIIDSHTVLLRLAIAMLRAVSVNGFQLMMTRPNGFASGMPKLAHQPPTASTTQAMPAQWGPRPGIAINRPPRMEPSRIAAKVALSIHALPLTSSSLCRCWGRIEYLSGPNTVECRPIRNSAASRKGTEAAKKPAAASNAIEISASLTQRISVALSKASAICPAEAENRNIGSTKRPDASWTISVGARPITSPPWKVIKSSSACLSTLSLKAPRNWVAKSGAKRRVLSSGVRWGIGRTCSGGK